MNIANCTFTDNYITSRIYGGGAIIGYASTDNYGDCVQGATISLSGNVRISGSTVSRQYNNLHLDEDHDYGPLVLNIAGSLTNTVPIPVSVDFEITAGNPLVFTSGLAGKGTAENFVSVDDHYIVVLTADGEAALAVKSEITFDAGDGEGEMDAVIVASGSEYPLPTCGFDGPVDMAFKEWSVVIGSEDPVTGAPGDTITVTADATVTAVWEEIPFGTPDFVLPAGVTAVEANAFEGIAATIVEIPENCASIGDYAFRDCADLTMIRIPADCALGTDVFDGCAKVYIFGTAGSAAQAYCRTHDNCLFVEEGQP